MNQLIEGGFINKWLNDEFDKVAKKADIGASTEAEPLTVDNLQVNKMQSILPRYNSNLVIIVWKVKKTVM